MFAPRVGGSRLRLRCDDEDDDWDEDPIVIQPRPSRPLWKDVLLAAVPAIVTGAIEIGYELYRLKRAEEGEEDEEE